MQWNVSITWEWGEKYLDIWCTVVIKRKMQYNTQCIESVVFTPMCRSDDCIFNPVSKAGGRQGRREEKEYNVQLSPMQVMMVMLLMVMMMVRMMVVMIILILQLQMRKSTDHQHPEFVVNSITTEGFRWPWCHHHYHHTKIQSPSPSYHHHCTITITRRPVSRTINCGSKSEIAQVMIFKY